MSSPTHEKYKRLIDLAQKFLTSPTITAISLLALLLLYSLYFKGAIYLFIDGMVAIVNACVQMYCVSEFIIKLLLKSSQLSIIISCVARMPQKVRTSKGDYWIKP